MDFGVYKGCLRNHFGGCHVRFVDFVCRVGVRERIGWTLNEFSENTRWVISGRVWKNVFVELYMG